MELCELLEGVFAGDIGVEDEEGGIILSEDLLGQLQGAGGAQGLVLDRDGNIDSELLLILRDMLGLASRIQVNASLVEYVWGQPTSARYFSITSGR